MRSDFGGLGGIRMQSAGGNRERRERAGSCRSAVRGSRPAVENRLRPSAATKNERALPRITRMIVSASSAVLVFRLMELIQIDIFSRPTKNRRIVVRAR